MSLFNRISKLVTASLNDMLDGLENPQRMLNQLIREMDDSIAALRREITNATARENLAKQRLVQHDAEIAKWQENAALAVAQDKDDLARQALLKKKDLEDQRADLEQQIAEQTDAVKELREQLHQLEEKIQEARRKRDSLSPRHVYADTSAGDIITGFDQFVNKDDAATPPDLAKEFRDLKRQQAVDAELDALKKKLKKNT